MEKHQGTLNEFAVAQDKIHTLSSKLNEIKDIEKNVQVSCGAYMHLIVKNHYV